ncbi:MAG: DUF4034 domain-containing protein, partial [Candidatus Methylacidiphilales bacterium]
MDTTTFFPTRLGLFTLCLISSWVQSAELVPIKDGPEQRAEFRKAVFQLFEQERFDLLESMGNHLVDKQERFPEGLWKAERFFSGCDNDVNTDAEARAGLERLDRWEKQFPQSEWVPILRASLWNHYAWAARGSGYANTVTDEGWKNFAKRLAEAKRILEATPSRADGSRNPFWYLTMQTTALGQSWKRSDYEALFLEATTHHPDFHYFYLKKGYFLLPRWYGKKGEWQKFAVEASKKHGAD